MEGKVILYDSRNNRIGETFVRRARQLVKQQRAAWTDDNCTAIRFAHGMENMDDSTDDTDKELIQRSDEELMKLAKRRVQARFALVLHGSIVLMLSVLLIMIYFVTDPGGYFWPVWPISSFIFSIVIHAIVYKMTNGDDTMRDQISREYERLKHQRSYEDIS